MRSLLLALALLGAILSGTPAIAGEKGWFGFAMAIDVEGSPLNPKLRTVKVDSVVPASPAASAGIVPGDLFLEVEWISIDRATPLTVQNARQISFGESLHLESTHGAEPPRELVL